jgi:RNA polymerase sigma-70 factor (ECF subfamily)
MRSGADGKGGEDRWGTLLAAALAGDARAYREFLHEAAPFARAMARRKVAEDLVEDVVQDVLLTVHRVRHTYQPGLPVKPWLSAIVARRAIDALRRSGRTGRREVHDPIAHETYADPRANREEPVDAAETLQRLTLHLSPGQKEALDLVKIREMSLVEASAASGQSVASLKVNIHRAIKKIRANLSKDGRL